MFVIYGKRKARIKQFTDNRNYCKSCKSFDLSVKVYKEFFHVFFIPFFPTGEKTVNAVCNNCGQPYRTESVLRQYERNTRNPVYLYSGLILIVILVLFIVKTNLGVQNEKAQFVQNPKVGDVYKIRKDENNSPSYYFLRVMGINGDTIVTYRNNIVYSVFTTKLEDNDFFVKDQNILLTKEELKQMLAKDEINSVERDYDSSEGFNRIK